MSAKVYSLISRLEKGELADLYRAVRGGDHNWVLRLYHPHTTDWHYANVVAKTAGVLRQVGDERLVCIEDVGLISGRLALVRKLIEGCSLGQLLKKLRLTDTALSWHLGVAILADAAGALELAHRAGVVHGALTAGNVFLTEKGRIALTDFSALTAFNIAPRLKVMPLKGRNRYRAHEILKGNPPSIQSDIYSLGAIAYEMLTLREPGESSQQRREHGIEDADTQLRVDQRLPSRLEEILRKAVHRNPERRYISCGEFLATLYSFLADNGGMPPTESLGKVALESVQSQEPLYSPDPLPFPGPFTLTDYGEETTQPGVEEKIRPRAQPDRGLIPSSPISPDEPVTEMAQPVFQAARSSLETHVQVRALEPWAKRMLSTVPYKWMLIVTGVFAIAVGALVGFWFTDEADSVGYLSVSANTSAAVYIDGKKVEKKAPLENYPVGVGVHTIEVLAIHTGEKHLRKLQIQRGQVDKIEEVFLYAPKGR